MNNPLQHVADALDLYVTLGVLAHHPAVRIPQRVRERLPAMSVDDVVTAMSEFERVTGGRLHELDPELPAIMDRYNEGEYEDAQPEPKAVPAYPTACCGTVRPSHAAIHPAYLPDYRGG